MIRQRPVNWQDAGAVMSMLPRASAAAPDCRRQHEGEGPSGAVPELGLFLPGDGLDPAERLPDTLAETLTDGVAAMPGRAAIDLPNGARSCSAPHVASLSSSAVHYL
jgi:hypothetical protein